MRLKELGAITRQKYENLYTNLPTLEPFNSKKAFTLIRPCLAVTGGVLGSVAECDSALYDIVVLTYLL